MIYLNLFLIFFKVGLFGFGGGYAILTMIYQEIQIFGIMSPDDFSNLVALSQVTPGPIGVNAATYVGFRAAGFAGALVATFAVSLPSFILIMIVLTFVQRFRTNVLVQSVLRGIIPATIGLLAGAFCFMFHTAIVVAAPQSFSLSSIASSIDYVALFIFIITIILIRSRKLGVITITLLGGAISLVLQCLVQSA